MISLIVPVYNVKPFLKEFLDSVISQSFEDYEALLIDDGSTDGTEKILDGYAEKYPRLKVIHKANEGVVRTWKRGILEAKGEYLAFADPDDILKPNMLDVLYSLMTANDVDLVISGISRLENGQQEVMPADNWQLSEGLYDGEKLEYLKNNLFGNVNNKHNIFFFARWNKLFKREILLKNLDYSHNDVKLGDDVCFCASAIYDSERLYYTHEPLYIYRIRTDSLTTIGFDTAQIENAVMLRDSVRKMITEKGYMNDFIYYNYPTYHMIWLMRKIKATTYSKKEKIRLLSFLKMHEYVAQYNLKQAKKFISRKRYWAIWLLKHSQYSLLLRLL